MEPNKYKLILYNESVEISISTCILGRSLILQRGKDVTINQKLHLNSFCVSDTKP